MSFNNKKENTLITPGQMQNVPLLLKTLLNRAAQVCPDEQIITRISDGYHVISYAEHQTKV
jgi:hypothetical protein